MCSHDLELVRRRLKLNARHFRDLLCNAFSKANKGI